MNRSLSRLVWGIAFLVLASFPGWTQSTWRGQAEVWSAATAPTEGFVVATNDFPRNSLLTVENYKTKKTVEVRVVAALPAGSSALVLLNLKAAQALDIRTGETPLVGVRLSATGVERADNPDPDVNPMAETLPTVAPVAVASPPVAVPEPATNPATELKPRTPPVNALEITQGATKLDPDLLPLPLIAEPVPVPEPARVPLAIEDDSGAPVPLTPGKKVFLTTREPEPVAVEAPVAVPEPIAEVPPVTETPVVAEAPAVTEAPVVAEAPEVTETPVVAEAPPVEVAPEPIADQPAVAEAPAVEAPIEVTPEAPIASNPVTAAPPATSALAPLPQLAATATAWVSTPGRLVGPVLGQIAILPSLEKGKSYVQIGAWSDEATLLKVLDGVASYVPLVLYRAEGEKNPWRLLVATAPKGQMGVLLMSFRSQGFRSASVVKG